MKKFIIGCAFVSLATIASAQNPKTAYTRASMDLNAYRLEKTKVNSLKSAVKDIEFVVAHERTKGEAKHWRQRGEVYYSVSGEAKVNADYPEAIYKAYTSYVKALELDLKALEAKGKPVAKLKGKGNYKNAFDKIARELYSSGADAYNGKKNELAYKLFYAVTQIEGLTKEPLGKKQVVLVVNNIDLTTESARYAAEAALRIGKIAEAEALYAPLLEQNKIKEDLLPGVYATLAKAYFKAKQTKKAKEVLNKGRKLFPKNQDLLYTEINIALSEGRIKELEDQIKQAIEASPNDVELLFVLGNVYDGIFREKLENATVEEAEGFYTQAVNWYAKGVEVDATHFNCLYSLGAIRVNYSNFYAKQLNEMDYSTPEYKTVDARYKALIDESLTYLLAAEKVKPEDLSVVLALKEVYGRKDDEANFMKYKKRVETLRK